MHKGCALKSLSRDCFKATASALITAKHPCHPTTTWGPQWHGKVIGAVAQSHKTQLEVPLSHVKQHKGGGGTYSGCLMQPAPAPLNIPLRTSLFPNQNISKQAKQGSRIAWKRWGATRNEFCESSQVNALLADVVTLHRESHDESGAILKRLLPGKRYRQ